MKRNNENPTEAEEGAAEREEQTLHAKRRRTRAVNKVRSFEQNLELLKAFKLKHGHTKVPFNYPEDPVLSTWVANTRFAYRSNTLKPERKAALDEIGFDWRRRNDSIAWYKSLELLKEYKQQHGDCLVPQSYPVNPSLGIWVHTQRNNFRKSKLDDDQRSALEQLGFVWRTVVAPPTKRNWDESYQVLQQYKERHGDCNVPWNYAPDLYLGRWVGKQRTAFRRNALKEEHRKALDDIGFEWRTIHSFPRDAPALVNGDKTASPLPFVPRKTLHDAQWNASYARLQAYREKHGHTRVPYAYKEDLKLANWISVQRRANKFGKLDSARREQLDAIGFDWILSKGCKPKPIVNHEATEKESPVNESIVKELAAASDFDASSEFDHDTFDAEFGSTEV
ncbi:hypothetical protein MPSEU_000056100 [Mayamaea pseudoterrestris]|nr:hypothetical protein MPSEU_000056100 [Mayamaea pseudoterrestris]